MSARKTERTLSDDEIEEIATEVLDGAEVAADTSEMTSGEALYFWEYVQSQATGWVNGLREDIASGRGS